MPDTHSQQISKPATLNFPPPERFSSKFYGLEQADSWRKWLKRFERYRTASGLKDKSPEEQVSTFLYCMGECADDIIKTLNIDEEKATYEEVKMAINNYFEVRRNVIVERVKFNKRVQQPGEPIDSFIQDLYRIADDCEYGVLKNELIRDRIIVGVLDDALSDKLQSNTKLTLDEAVKISRQSEARKQSKDVVRGAQPSTNTVNFVKRLHKPTANSTTRYKPDTSKQAQTGPQCTWCGNKKHDRKDCPAKNASCLKCGKRGHFQKVCHSQTSTSHKPKVHELDIDEDSAVPFLGEIQGGGDSWTVQVGINNNVTRCKLDTGASVSVVSDSLKWLKDYPLNPEQQSLMGPGGTRLHVQGSFTATVSYRQCKIEEKFYVIKNQSCSLLSRSACVKLGLVQRLDTSVDEVSPSPDFKAEFPQLFQGLGKVNTECHITLRDNADPYCLYTPRRVAHPLLPQVKQELDSMLKEGVISPVTCPTQWCAGMVPVPKSNGRLRICVDLTHLNKAVQRELHPMPSVDESLAKLGQGKLFSKLDANSGFWQLPLDMESRLLTTFITPYGRYCFNRLPFGISSAPEIFQRVMSSTLEGLKGVICQLDDVLIHGADQSEHDARVRAALSRVQAAGFTLNDKCEFSQTSIKFLGHIIDSSGVHADPDKTTAISEFPRPTTITELQRFLGMVNHLGKFVPELSIINEPLRQLLHKESVWSWGCDQEKAFQRLKELLQSPTVLAHYSPLRPTVIAADASATGIGAVLLQVQDDGQRQPICFASRSLNETEQRYAVIEKEALATTWSCERFAQYVTGLQFTIETDHKPLTTLMNSKELAKMPARIQRFRLRLMRFNPHVVYVQGKNQVTADALSRAPIGQPKLPDDQFANDVEFFAVHSVNVLPATPHVLKDISNAQKSDEECTLIREYCNNRWPTYFNQNPVLRPYWDAKAHLSVVDDLLLYDDRLVIPRSKRLEILDKIHTGHLGITKCRTRASQSVWWPGVHDSIQEMVSRCNTCAKFRPHQREPLLAASFPSRPWEKVGADLFDLNGKTYIAIVDYYSRWLEIKRVTSETSESIIKILKEVFSTHGIPDLIISDNGPQFSAETFQEFARDYCFQHVTSSPKYPQANGEAERAVNTAKKLLQKNADVNLALLTYRSSPLQNGLSPAELLMGRRLKTQLPVLPKTLHPKPQDLETVKQKEDYYRVKQQEDFNRRYRARELPNLHQGDRVWIRDQHREAEVISKAPHPRSFLVKTDNGILRRNRSALINLDPTDHSSTKLTGNQSPEPDSTAKSTVDTSNVEPSVQPELNTESTVTTRSGRLVKPPQRLDL